MVYKAIINLFPGIFKVSTLYYMCKSISPTASFGYNEMLSDRWEFFFAFLLAHYMNRFPNFADPKDDWKVILRSLTDKCQKATS